MRPLSASLKASLESQTAEFEEHLDLALLYLQARGIDQDTAKSFRLGVVGDKNSKYYGRLAIPSLGLDSAPYNIRFRSLDGSEPKYLGLPGVETRLFNVRAIHEADDEIHITEGELDAVVLNRLGLRAVGVCGANAWKKHHARMFAGFVRVYVWGDGDDAGSKFSAKVSDTLVSAYRCKVESGLDVTDLYLTSGEAGINKAMGLEDEDDA